MTPQSLWLTLFHMQVGFGEQFKVESMKVEGYYLHCSDTDLNTVSFSVNRKWWVVFIYKCVVVDVPACFVGDIHY